ncbi:MAG: NAD-dependent epimerase/dehydratase family protein [Myxococcales bacterium]|nr:NAD-dependent epimerase/dehydratase family protein [Myxococcales bacterium]
MKTHTVFGAGQIGLRLATELVRQGDQVRLVRRGAAGPDRPGITWLSGDASDPAFAARACEGSSVVYNCANPADYHRWDGLLQPLYRSIWRGAAEHGARLVQLDNLYAVGEPPVAPFDERTPLAPVRAHGELRRLLFEELMGMHEAGALEVTVGRASDFFGPASPRVAVFRDDVIARLAAGKAVFLHVAADMPHSYSYIPDVVRGLAVLGNHEATTGRVWHLPMAAQLTTRELLDRFAQRAGHDAARIVTIPRWLIRGIGLVVPMVRAIDSMSYQWDLPYLADDGDFRRLLGIAPTPLDTAIDETLAAVGGAALLAPSQAGAS